MEPLYKEKDVKNALGHFVSIPYDKWFAIRPGVKLFFRDAGHILGSASVTLEIEEGDKTTRLGFTGDIGRPEMPILRDPQPMPQVDYLISESTYGGRVHESKAETKEVLYDVIHETCVKNKGKLIIPAFSVGRTQLLVHAMDQLEREGRLPKIPVFVDSPLAVNATEIFEVHPECFDDDLLDYMKGDPDPFGFNGLHYIRRVEASKQLNTRMGPAVIISASGMITAGRIMHHVKNNVEDPKNTILIVGYCAEGTIGSRLIEGDETIRIHGDDYQVNAKVVRLNSMSAHADQSEMLDFFSNQDPNQLKKIFLVHGSEQRTEWFMNYLTGNGYDEVIVPSRGESFFLD